MSGQIQDSVVHVCIHEWRTEGRWAPHLAALGRVGCGHGYKYVEKGPYTPIVEAGYKIVDGLASMHIVINNTHPTSAGT